MKSIKDFANTLRAFPQTAYGCLLLYYTEYTYFWIWIQSYPKELAMFLKCETFEKLL